MDSAKRLSNGRCQSMQRARLGAYPGTMIGFEKHHGRLGSNTVPVMSTTKDLSLASIEAGFRALPPAGLDYFQGSDVLIFKRSNIIKKQTFVFISICFTVWRLLVTAVANSFLYRSCLATPKLLTHRLEQVKCCQTAMRSASEIKDSYRVMTLMQTSMQC